MQFGEAEFWNFFGIEGERSQPFGKWRTFDAEWRYARRRVVKKVILARKPATTL